MNEEFEEMQRLGHGRRRPKPLASDENHGEDTEYHREFLSLTQNFPVFPSSRLLRKTSRLPKKENGRHRGSHSHIQILVHSARYTQRLRGGEIHQLIHLPVGHVIHIHREHHHHFLTEQFRHLVEGEEEFQVLFGRFVIRGL